MKKTKFLPFLLLLFLAGKMVSAQHVPQLWSLTQNGGADGSGALFHYTPSTNEEVLDFSWPNTTPGQAPEFTSLTQDSQGKFYGMTSWGGAKVKGVIFEWDKATNSYSKRFDFNGIDGGNPYGSLTYLNGKFYGMTRYGGANNKGVIFEWDPTSNVYSKKIDFSATNGGEPYGSMTLFNEKFYGMTSLDGTNEQGTIFEWDPATNVYSKKIDFNGIDGARPFGSLTLSDGIFYGVTVQGGTNNLGAIFEWNPSSNTYSKKIDLTVNEGYYPFGSLTLFNGKLYGMSKLGGTSNQGVIFEWDPGNNIYSRKIDFIGTNGASPFGTLTLLNGKLFGTTQQGGGVGGSGIIFEWDPLTNEFTKKFKFDYANGGYPQSSLTLAEGKFYGLTRNGGFNRVGVIFEWDPATNAYTKKIDFDNTIKGGYPTGSLTYWKGKFYGMTNRGGANGTGVIFEWNPYSNIYTKKFDFIEAKGHYPSGDLTLYNGKFYGITTSGGEGVNNAGVIFEWDPAANIYTSKFTLNGPDGRNSYGSLALYNGKFYGTTLYGGANDHGVIFEWSPTTNTYIKKIDFENTGEGRHPLGSLTLFDGKFYGTTTGGGVNGYGAIFEWDPSTNNYVKKFDFDATVNGRSPMGSLALANGKLYGTTYFGGPGPGIIFEWNPATNDFAKKIDFEETSKGSYPLGSLFYSGDKFYGMTSSGGVNNYGVIFEWNPTTNAFSKKLDFNAENGANPQYSQFIEVLSNKAPVLSNLPVTQNKCVKAASGNANFTVTDSDGDSQTFTVNSSNETLLQHSKITITNISENHYTISYVPEVNATGTAVVNVTSNDGYDGEASFSFELIVSPPQPVINVDLTDIAAPMLTSSGTSGNQWYLNGSVIEGAVEKTYVVKDMGTYQVSVTVDNCTSLLSEGKTFIVTGDVANPTEKVQLFPNPVHEQLTIQLNGFKADAEVTVTITDSIGKKVGQETGYGGKELTVDVKGYVNGFYYVNMKQGSSAHYEKFIKR